MRHAGLAGALALAVLALAPANAQQVTDIESEGNLAPHAPVGCVALDAVPSGSNPVDLYNASFECVRGGAFVKARELMMLGDVRGRFDAGRVTDTTARAAWVVAKQNVQARFKREERAGLEAAFRELMDEGLRCSLGERIVAQGAPDYAPTYMIRHGMGAVTGGAEQGVSVYPDPVKAYADVVRGYLRCPAPQDQ